MLTTKSEVLIEPKQQTNKEKKSANGGESKEPMINVTLEIHFLQPEVYMV